MLAWDKSAFSSQSLRQALQHSFQFLQSQVVYLLARLFMVLMANPWPLRITKLIKLGLPRRTDHMGLRLSTTPLQVLIISLRLILQPSPIRLTAIRQAPKKDIRGK